MLAQVAAAALPVCEQAGVSLWDVTFEKEGGRNVLTVFIDHPDGVQVDSCEQVSRALDPVLDEPRFDSLPAYVFSVSSPGLERRIARPEHFDWAQGRMVTCGFYKARDGVMSVTGTLLGHSDTQLQLQPEGAEPMTLDRADVAWLKQYFAF